MLSDKMKNTITSQPRGYIILVNWILINVISALCTCVNKITESDLLFFSSDKYQVRNDSPDKMKTYHYFSPTWTNHIDELNFNQCYTRVVFVYLVFYPNHHINIIIVF